MAILERVASLERATRRVTAVHLYQPKVILSAPTPFVVKSSKRKRKHTCTYYFLRWSLAYLSLAVTGKTFKATAAEHVASWKRPLKHVFKMNGLFKNWYKEWLVMQPKYPFPPLPVTKAYL